MRTRQVARAGVTGAAAARAGGRRAAGAAAGDRRLQPARVGERADRGRRRPRDPRGRTAAGSQGRPIRGRAPARAAHRRPALPRRRRSSGPTRALSASSPAAARRASARGPYAPRLVDAPLREALADAPFVLVFGDARAGKSRAAFEAVRAALAGAWVVVPRDPDGLRTLLEENPEPRLHADSIRPAMPIGSCSGSTGSSASPARSTAPHLDALPGHSRAAGPSRRDPSQPAVTVVATIREPTWDGLLAADGEPGEFAKAVAARARAFRVPSALDPEREAPRARELYPDADLSGGLGAGPCRDRQAGRAADPAAGRPRAAAAGEPARRRTWLGGVWDDKLLLAPLAGCLLAAGAVVRDRPRRQHQQAGAADDRRAGRRDHQRGQRGRADLAGIGIERADFHGSGTESYVFGFRGRGPGL